MTSAEELIDIERIIELLDLAAFDWHSSLISCEQVLNSKAVKIIEDLLNSHHTEVSLKRKGQYVTDLNDSDVFEVSIDLPKGQQCCLVKNPDDLLSVYYLHALPENYAIAQPLYISWGCTEAGRPAVIDKIVAAQNFIESLERFGVFEHDSHSRSYVVHANSGKSCIPYQSDRGYINSVSLEIQDAVEILAEAFKDSIHLREKERIFRNAIADAMRSCDLEMRLRHLLKHASEIMLVARNNYDLFVSGFSFQSDQEKLYEQRREFNVKLNALLSGIQGKLLAIPVSTILATSQLKNVGEENYIIINVAIIFSAAFFTLIISWLILSQLAALNAIKIEIELKENRFKVELPRIFSEVESIFLALRSSCKFNMKVAKIIFILAIVLFLVTFYVYVLKTPSLKFALLGFYEFMSDFVSTIFEVLANAVLIVRYYFG